MEFKELVKVNAQLKTTQIKGKDYVEVNERIKAFRQLFPNGTITTEIVDLSKDEKGKGVCVFKATALNEQGMILGTGHAYEKEGSSFINSTSYIENAETSAVGRALGMLGIGIDTSIASFDEVANAVEQQKAKETKAPAKAKITAQAPATDNDLPFEIADHETNRDKFREYVKITKMQDAEVMEIIKVCGLKNDSPDVEWGKALLYAQGLGGVS